MTAEVHFIDGTSTTYFNVKEVLTSDAHIEWFRISFGKTSKAYIRADQIKKVVVYEDSDDEQIHS